MNDSVVVQVSADLEASISEQHDLLAHFHTSLSGHLSFDVVDSLVWSHSQSEDFSALFHIDCERFREVFTNRYAAPVRHIVIVDSPSRAQLCSLIVDSLFAWWNAGLFLNSSLQSSDRLVWLHSEWNGSLAVRCDHEHSESFRRSQHKSQHVFVANALVVQVVVVVSEWSSLEVQDLLGHRDSFDDLDLSFHVANLVGRVHFEFDAVLVWCENKDSKWFVLSHDKIQHTLVWHSMRVECPSWLQSVSSEEKLKILDRNFELLGHLSVQFGDSSSWINCEQSLLLLVVNKDSDWLLSVVLENKSGSIWNLKTPGSAFRVNWIRSVSQ